MRSPLPAALAAVCALLLTSVLAGCAASADGTASSSATTTVAPSLADVRDDVLADPRSWEGPTSAVTAPTPVDPVSGPEPQLPVTIEDAQGTEVTITDTSRILALDVHGTLSRTVHELGLGGQVVGRDISTQFAEAADLPLVTQNGHDLNAEAILALDPTVILTDTSLGPWDVVLQMRDAGIPVIVTDSHRGLDNLSSLTMEVADALGVPERGRTLAERIESEVTAVTEQIEAVAPADPTQRLRTVFLYVRGQSGVYYLFGEGSGADSLIDAVGLYDVAEEIGWDGMKPITDEGIVAAQPELVLMMTDGLESAGGVDGLLERLPALASTPAGQQRRFVDMADAEILGFGPTTATTLNALAVAVHAPGAVS